MPALSGGGYDPHMDFPELRRRALALPVDERAALAADLLATLEGETVLAAVVEQRARALLSGEDPGEAWEDVRDRLRAELER